MAAPRKDNIKEKILLATAELLKTHPLAELSLADIAAAAGISKGTLYYHYKTKNEIFMELTEDFLREQWEDLIRWTENKEKDTSLERLVRYVADRDFGGPLLSERFSRLRPERCEIAFERGACHPPHQRGVHADSAPSQFYRKLA